MKSQAVLLHSNLNSSRCSPTHLCAGPPVTAKHQYSAIGPERLIMPVVVLQFHAWSFKLDDTSLICCRCYFVMWFRAPSATLFALLAGSPAVYQGCKGKIASDSSRNKWTPLLGSWELTHKPSWEVAYCKKPWKRYTSGKQPLKPLEMVVNIRKRGKVLS